LGVDPGRVAVAVVVALREAHADAEVERPEAEHVEAGDSSDLVDVLHPPDRLDDGDDQRVAVDAREVLVEVLEAGPGRPYAGRDARRARTSPPERRPPLPPPSRRAAPRRPARRD